MSVSAPRLPDTHATRVLVVDDDEQVRRMTRLMLCSEGFEVVEAASAGEATRLFDCETFDIVVTDLYMPDEDGRVLIARLRACDRRVPIVVVSGGSVHDRWSQPAEDLGADAVVQKPFSAEDLVIAVWSVLPIGA
jgi:DNA-binding response OmpR family regulator